MAQIPPPLLPPQKSKTALILILVGAGIIGFCVLAAVMAAILFPVFAEAKDAAYATNCLSNLKRVATAHIMYSVDNDDRFALAADWQDRIEPFASNPAVFRCPKLADLPNAFGYAMIAELSGKKTETVPEPHRQPLHFESTMTSRNASSGLDSIPDPSRHARRNGVAYVDGSVEGLRPAQ